MMRSIGPLPFDEVLEQHGEAFEVLTDRRDQPELPDVAGRRPPFLEKVVHEPTTVDAVDLGGGIRDLALSRAQFLARLVDQLVEARDLGLKPLQLDGEDGLFGGGQGGLDLGDTVDGAADLLDASTAPRGGGRDERGDLKHGRGEVGQPDLQKLGHSLEAAAEGEHGRGDEHEQSGGPRAGSEALEALADRREQAERAPARFVDVPAQPLEILGGFDPRGDPEVAGEPTGRHLERGKCFVRRDDLPGGLETAAHTPPLQFFAFRQPCTRVARSRPSTAGPGPPFAVPRPRCGAPRSSGFFLCAAPCAWPGPRPP